jgi:hypothetical protein
VVIPLVPVLLDEVRRQLDRRRQNLDPCGLPDHVAQAFRDGDEKIGPGDDRRQPEKVG